MTTVLLIVALAFVGAVFLWGLITWIDIGLWLRKRR